MSIRVKNFKDFRAQVLKNEEFIKRLQTNPKTALDEVEEKNPIYNVKVFKTVVFLVAGIVLACVIFIGFITLTNKGEVKIPESLVAIASTALGAIAGLLVPFQGNE